eukprot:CAMPEP_0196579410 /NCGR_PEP_ID=MMETSP1081-20130531/21658_1 /TAXON_ID=36882 /ORGANISM="Pyramimonas amylifera, Strain CCMP720" /LENGTH=211 /DNA_ID=CAMNT_0041898991 /DNA_START=149 /DNA_END=784 /DNA_ORIENTATION=-
MRSNTDFRQIHQTIWQTNKATDATDTTNVASSGQEESTSENAEGVDDSMTLLAEKEAEVLELNDKLLRSLAEMENVRARMQRQIDDSRKFGIQSFVKELLDVADNLQRAAGSVPSEADSADLSAESTIAMLKNLREGVLMTEKQLFQVFGHHGVEKYNSMGEKFDPNLHMALFELPSPEAENGTVGNVVKEGYTLHGRVVRPAEVGVVKNA